MSELTSADWSEVASSNNAPVPNGFPEGMNPSGVNNAARETMSAIKKFWNRLNFAYTAGGGTTAYTLTPTVALAAYAQEIWTWKMPSTNAVDATMNISGLGARNIRKLTTAGYANVAAGDLPSGSFVMAVYNTADNKLDVVGVTSGADFNIAGLTAETALALDDVLPLYDLSATANRKMTPANILNVLNLLTEDTTPDNVADFGLVYDTSASGVKKVLLSQMGQMINLTPINLTGASAADIVIDTTNYRALLIYFDAVVMTSDGANLLARVSIDGGSTFISTGTYFHARSVADDSPAINAGGSATDTAIVVVGTVDSTASQNLSGAAELVIGGAAASATKLVFRGGYVSTGGRVGNFNGYGSNTTASQINAIRFLPSTSTFASGFIYPYAILK